MSFYVNIWIRLVTFLKKSLKYTLSPILIQFVSFKWHHNRQATEKSKHVTINFFDKKKLLNLFLLVLHVWLSVCLYLYPNIYHTFFLLLFVYFTLLFCSFFLFCFIKKIIPIVWVWWLLTYLSCLDKGRLFHQTKM